MKRQEHYAALDGLRGFAAASVVLFHLEHWLNIPGLATNSVLAVDFFFCLSGYVLSLAYGAKQNPTLSAPVFFRIRLIRLMPLIVAATLISGAYVTARIFVNHDHVAFHDLVLAVFLGLCSIPYLNAPKAIGGPQIFPLNGPQFTLFLEFVVNFFWFYGRNHIGLYRATLIAVMAVIGIVIFGLGGDVTATIWLGIPRVTASFFAGVVLFNIDQRFAISRSLAKLFWPLVLVMVLLFYYPHALSLNIDLIWIIFIGPILVLAGSKVTLSGFIKRAALLGGELSYPIYVLQYPIFSWVNGIFQMLTHQRRPLIEAPLIFVIILGLSFVILRVYDGPVRAMLSARSRKRGAITKPSLAG